MNISAAGFYNVIRPRRLLDSVSIIIMILVVALLVAFGSIFSQMAFDIVDKQMQKRAIQTAEQLTGLTAIHDFIQSSSDSKRIFTPITDFVPLPTDAEYVFVTDIHGKLISHPDSALIGTHLKDTLATRALIYGSAYTQRTLENGRPYIRGSVPVIDKRYRIIGMVSVGYPLDTLRKASDDYLEKIIFFTFVFITLGLIAAIFIAKGVKWIIFGLEPAEIAYMFQE